MSINDLLEKGKPFYNLLLIVVIASIFFALGRLSVLEEKNIPVKIEYPNGIQTASAIQSIGALGGSASTTEATQASGNTDSGEVIASKNGTKYYFPWCGSAKMIKPENIVKFASTDEARKAGYTPASNCKGLK